MFIQHQLIVGMSYWGYQKVKVWHLNKGNCHKEIEYYCDNIWYKYVKMQKNCKGSLFKKI